MSCAKTNEFDRPIGKLFVRREFLKSIFYNTVGIGVIRGANLVVAIYFANELSVADYATYGVGFNIVMTFSVICVLGFGTGSVSYISSNNTTGKQLDFIYSSLLLVLAIALVFSCALFFLRAEAATYFYGNQAFAEVIGFAAVSVLSAALFGLAQSYLAALCLFREKAATQLATSVLIILLQVVGYKSAGLYGIIAGLALGNLIGLALSLIFVYRKIPFTFRRIDPKTLKNVFGYCLPLSISVLLVMPAPWIAQVIISSRSGAPVDIAIYQIALYWQNILMFFAASICGVVLPYLNKLRAGNSLNRRSDRRLFVQGAAVYIVVFVMIILPLVIFDGNLAALYGDNYADQGSIFRNVAGYSLLSAIAMYLGQWLISLKLFRLAIFSNALWMVCFLVASFVIREQDVIQTVYIGFYLAYALQTIFITFYVWRNLDGPNKQEDSLLLVR